ncbi:ABC transporter permease [Halostagnicola bangensis]
MSTIDTDRRTRRFDETIRSLLSRVGTWFCLLFIYSLLLVPVGIVVLTSVADSPAPTLPTNGITLEWYVSLAQNQRIFDAVVNSTIIATVASALAGVIGTATAFGFVRSDISRKETLATVMLLPIMISPVIAGLALLRFGASVGIPAGYSRIILAHTILTFPFVFLIVRARLLTFDDQLEDASMTLGATRLETVVNVTLPILAPAITAGTLLAFAISFGEFTATQFLVAPGTTTVPVIIYNEIQTGLTPEISALASVLVFLMILVGVLGDRIN